MQRVRISVDRLRRFTADTSFEVYGDLGSGEIDFDHPLTPHPVPLWPEATRRSGHLRDGHLTVRHLDGINPDGHLEAEHLVSEHLLPASAVTFDTPWYVFGRFAHAVKMFDGAKNASGATTLSVTVNSGPTAPRCVMRSGYDEQVDRLSFSFEPSRFEPVSGQ